MTVKLSRSPSLFEPTPPAICPCYPPPILLLLRRTYLRLLHYKQREFDSRFQLRRLGPVSMGGLGGPKKELAFLGYVQSRFLLLLLHTTNPEQKRMNEYAL